MLPLPDDKTHNADIFYHSFKIICMRVEMSDVSVRPLCMPTGANTDRAPTSDVIASITEEGESLAHVMTSISEDGGSYYSSSLYRRVVFASKFDAAMQR